MRDIQSLVQLVETGTLDIYDVYVLVVAGNVCSPARCPRPCRFPALVRELERGAFWADVPLARGHPGPRVRRHCRRFPALEEMRHTQSWLTELRAHARAENIATLNYRVLQIESAKSLRLKSMADLIARYKKARTAELGFRRRRLRRDARAVLRRLDAVRPKSYRAQPPAAKIPEIEILLVKNEKESQKPEVDIIDLTIDEEPSRANVQRPTESQRSCVKAEQDHGKEAQKPEVDIIDLTKESDEEPARANVQRPTESQQSSVKPELDLLELPIEWGVKDEDYAEFYE